MLIPNIQSWCRTLSTTLVKRIRTSSFGCGLQFCQTNSTCIQMNSLHRTTMIDPKIITFITSSGSLQTQLFKNVPNQHVNKITLRLPGLQKPQDFIYPVPLGNYGHLPVEKNLPSFIHQEKLDPIPAAEIRAPSTIQSSLEKLAARLIQIRKKKMRKHRLRKLRKRMFYTFAKIKQRREARREKHFIDCQLARITKAVDFNAEEWVNEYLRKSITDPATLIVKKPKLPRPTRYVF